MPPPSITNYNSSCYLTSAVHCLLLVTRDLPDPPRWLYEIQRAASKGQKVSGRDVVGTYGRAGGEHQGQGDPAEAIDVLLDKMPEVAKHVRGALRHSTVCRKHGHVSKHSENFNVLDVGATADMVDACSCFEQLCAPVELADHKCYECGLLEFGDKVRDAKDPDKIITPGASVHRRQVQRISNFLILQVRRLFVGRKLRTPILLQDELEDESGNHYYLQGIVVHHGSAAGGHYNTYVRDFDGWWLCDDETVEARPRGYNEDLVKKNGVLFVYKIKRK